MRKIRREVTRKDLGGSKPFHPRERAKPPHERERCASQLSVRFVERGALDCAVCIENAKGRVASSVVNRILLNPEYWLHARNASKPLPSVPFIFQSPATSLLFRGWTKLGFRLLPYVDLSRLVTI